MALSYFLMVDQLPEPLCFLETTMLRQSPWRKDPILLHNIYWRQWGLFRFQIFECKLDVGFNGNTTLGMLNKDNLVSGLALYRSGKTSGVWRFIKYPMDGSSFRVG